MPSCRSVFCQFALFYAALAPAFCAVGEDILPLSEVKPGMVGEWRTVVSGTEVESFKLEVLGVAENFTGPQRSVIICQALDARSKLIGPVAGMSGSPVYIGGKLIGAYAYGFTWPKEQAIIGVTPIEQMLEILDTYPLEASRPRRASAPASYSFTSLAITGGEEGAGSLMPVFSSVNPVSSTGGENSGKLKRMQTLLAPLPTPMMASGFSERALRAFRPQLEALGLDVMQAPSGTAADGSKFSLEPGSPIAAVLMSGDFNMAATGTVTYRDGDTLLAFGHPFFQLGPTRFPMAGAEIITVIQSVNQSFKLSNTGPLLGSVYQDRLTAIAGKIGELPHLIEMSITTRGVNGVVRQFSGDLFEHRSLSPIFASISLLESLYQTMESSEEQTFYLDGRVELEGYDAIVFRDVASGPEGAKSVAMSFWENYLKLVNNPYGMPVVTKIDFNIDIRDEWLLSSLKAVQVVNKRVKPGGTVDLNLSIYNYLDKPTRHSISVPIPPGLQPGEALTILVADAAGAELAETSGRGFVTSVDDIIREWNHRRSRQSIYIKLLKKAPGLILDGENLPDLPPSVQALFTSPGNNTARQFLDETTLWETKIEIPGEFRGSYQVPITLE